MTRQTFTISDENEFISLDKLLKVMRMVGSGGEAHAAIQEGLVKVNGAVELQKRKKLRVGDTAEFNNHLIEITK